MPIKFSKHLINSFLIVFLASSAYSADICPKKMATAPGAGGKSQETEAFFISNDCPVSLGILKEKERLKTIQFNIQDLLNRNIGIKGLTRVETPERLIEVEKEVPPQEIEVCSVSLIFDLNSHVAHEKEIQKLHEECLTKIPKDTLSATATVTGYTCELGSEAHNMKLSTDRALEVAEHVKKDKAIQVEYSGKGECCPLGTRKESRRAEITIRAMVPGKGEQ